VSYLLLCSVVYLTALFYLLSNSSTTYRPMELLSHYSMFHLYGTKYLYLFSCR